VASKSGQQEPEKAEVIEELLDALDIALDRVKVLYEQYFLGIQKQPPAYLHTDVERKIRDLAQLQIRNTALRYRFATLQQKFGSYNSYWRRTLRQIESGTYTRNLYKVGRQAARTGAEVPEEILAAMPKRMREQVIRDREAALALAELRERQAHDDEPPALAAGDVEIDVGDLDSAAFIRESSDVRRNALTAAAVYRIDEADAEFDVDAFFASVAQDDAPSRDTLSRPAAAEPGSGAATRKLTGPMRTVPPSPDPRVEPAALGSATGRLRVARPPSNDDTEPRLSIPPVGSGSPAAATRKITGPMRTVRPPSNPDPEPAGGPPSGAAPHRVTGQTAAARPPPSEDPGPRLSIPSIGSASPGAATRRITGQIRAVRAPTDPGAEPAVRPSIPPVAPASPVTSSGAATRRITPPARARTPSNPDAEPSSAAPSQATKPLPVAPGSAAAHAATPVEILAGPFPRIPSSPASLADRASPPPPLPSGRRTPPPVRPAAPPSAPPKRTDAPPPGSGERPASEPRPALPPGMTDDDVNALYAKYVKAKQILGQEAEPGIYGKLLRTIHAQAPKIMEQYKARGVDFSVVVKDNQVIIRAKPKP
jgi:hypothetical protein